LQDATAFCKTLYATVVGGYKLAIRDFIYEHNLPLVVSLLCFGGALIVLPRLLHGKSAHAGRIGGESL